jgi:hypothetical protein
MERDRTLWLLIRFGESTLAFILCIWLIGLPPIAYIAISSAEALVLARPFNPEPF